MECRVVGLKEGSPSREGDLLLWRHFDAALSLRVLQLDGQATLNNDRHDETLYVIEGNGTADGPTQTGVSAPRLGPDTGVDLPAGHSLRLTGTMTLVSSLCPAEPLSRPVSIVRLQDQPVQKTGDRWYRELIQGQTTQFVGSIPPGRAPDHFHEYEEVIWILRGPGVMWADARAAPSAPGSCMLLPRRPVHRREDRGDGVLRPVGGGYRWGSPAVR